MRKSIVIFTDSNLSKTEGGISQTLYNLFNSYSRELLKVAVDINRISEVEQINDLDLEIIPVKFFQIKLELRNRVGLILENLFEKINILSNYLITKSSDKKNLSNHIILVSTTSPIIFIKAYKFAKVNNCPLIIYLMDDWLNQKYSKGYLSEVFRRIFRYAEKCVFISERMQEKLESWSHIKFKSHIVHNPVLVKSKYTPFDFTGNVLPIIYVGSIWQMHFDGIEFVSKAIQNLYVEDKKVELWIYCKEHFWKNVGPSLTNDFGRTIYKGFCNYDDLQNVLVAGWLLLVTASFHATMREITYSSVQTKTTDYMLAGRPILSIGPSYGACNDFVSKYEIGYVVDNLNVEQLHDKLKYIIGNKELYSQKCEKAYNTVAENFEITVTQEKLYSFLNA